MRALHVDCAGYASTVKHKLSGLCIVCTCCRGASVSETCLRIDRAAGQ